MFDAAALKVITELAQQAGEPKEFHPKAEPDHIYVLRGPDGTQVRTVAEPHPRGHQAADLTALTAKAQESILDGKYPELWYTRAGVTLFLCGLTRRDKVHLPLPPSPQLARLMQWEQSRTTINQSELILTMRTLFRDAVSGLNLADVIRRIKTQINTAVDQKRTGVSLGKEIMAQVGDASSIPDYVTFRVPVFAAGALSAITASIDCAFEFDAEKSLFMLLPVPGQIEAGFTAAEKSLRELILAGMKEPVETFGLYYGKP